MNPSLITNYEVPILCNCHSFLNFHKFREVCESSPKKVCKKVPRQKCELVPEVNVSELTTWSLIGHLIPVLDFNALTNIDFNQIYHCALVYHAFKSDNSRNTVLNILEFWINNVRCWYLFQFIVALLVPHRETLIFASHCLMQLKYRLLRKLITNHYLIYALFWSVIIKDEMKIMK